VPLRANLHREGPCFALVSEQAQATIRADVVPASIWLAVSEIEIDFGDERVYGDVYGVFAASGEVGPTNDFGSSKNG
jgi:hypothetical protein